MRKSATVRRVAPGPIDEGFCIRLSADTLVSVMTDLRRRVEHSGAPRSVAQILLAEAHVAEAVGLLRTILPPTGVRTSGFHSPSPSPPHHDHTRVQRAERQHQTQRVAV